jgi:hypothetical protein
MAQAQDAVSSSVTIESFGQTALHRERIRMTLLEV